MAAKILIVDDDPSTLASLSSALSSAGHEVASANNAEEALPMVNDNLSVIVTDLTMPGIGGLEFIKKIKIANQKVKIVVLTTSGGLDDLNQALQLGVQHYFNKQGLNIDSFVNTVTQLAIPQA